MHMKAGSILRMALQAFPAWRPGFWLLFAAKFSETTIMATRPNKREIERYFVVYGSHLEEEFSSI